MAAAAIPFGLGIGLSLGMLGGGGSVLAVRPVLVYVLGEGVHQAATASLVVVTAAAVVGGLTHVRDGRVCWRHAIAFIAAALPGVIAGTALGQAVSGRALIAAFAFIMLAAAATTWRKARHDAVSGRTERSRTSCPALQLARVLTSGLLVGAMTGFRGVGGGFLIVPTLAVALAPSMRMAAGTSLVIIATTSVMALSAHLAAGRTPDVGVTFAMTVSAIAGALAGVRLAGHVPQRQLGQGFAALAALVAHLRYPLRHRERWRSNLLERSLGEVRRRTKVMGRFPGETSCLSLVWAVLDLFFSRASNGATFTELDRQHLYRIKYHQSDPDALDEEVTAA